VSTFFISDLHLCPSRPEINAQFFRFLAGPARAAQALYILGDLFEYWAGDDDADDPFNQAVAQGLHQLADSGVAMHFMAGNRDFLLGDRYARRAGLHLLNDPALIDLEGTPTLLMHGDTLCTDDVSYQRFREQVRTPAWQQDFLALPLAARKAQIEDLRRKSEIEKSAKTMEIMDVNQHAVVATLSAHACTRLIHGHTHRPGQHLLEVDGRRCERWVLADWYTSGSYIACDANGCRAVTLG